MKVLSKNDYLYYKRDGKHYRVPASDKSINALLRRNYDCSDVLTLGGRLRIPLYPYQYQALLQAKNHNWNILDADSMGLGKTPTALGCIVASDARKVLIVCPAAIKYQWKRYIENWVTKPGIMYVCEGQKFEYGDCLSVKHANYVIINYNIYDYWIDLFCKLKWDMVVYDEAHRIKKVSIPSAPVRCSAAADMLVPHVKSCICLSGTPLTDRTADIWHIVKLVNPNLFRSYFLFQQQYCGGASGAFSSESRSTNTIELHNKLIDSGVMIRRTKKDVYKEIPRVDIDVVPFNVRSAALDMLEREARHQTLWMKKQTGKQRGAAMFKVRQSFEKYLQEAIRLKLPYIVEWLKDFMNETDEKIVVGCIHKELCGNALYHEFERSSVLINGDASAKQKDKLLTEFKTNKQKRILICNIQSMKEGVDGLQNVCSHMAICELPWSPADIDQLIARLDRNGQKERVNVSFLVVYDSIDEMLVRTLDRKKKITTEVLDGRAPHKKELLVNLLTGGC